MMQCWHADTPLILDTRHLQQWEKARQMSDEALKINPTYVKALQQRGRALTKLNDHEAARCARFGSRPW